MREPCGEGLRSPAQYSGNSTFTTSLRDSSARRSGSRIIAALDLSYREETDGLLEESMHILDQISDYVCAIKINFHLIIPLSIREIKKLNQFAHSKDLLSIADIKLNDIDNTNDVATSYLWDSGFDAVIVNPFAGLKGGLDVVYSKAHSQGKGVISLAYMSHPGADEGYGLETKDGGSVFQLMLERANSWGSDGVILGSTRAEKIREARSRLEASVKILSPGSGAQGGNPIDSIKAGADYLIWGRSIVAAKNPLEAARQIFETLQKLPD